MHLRVPHPRVPRPRLLALLAVGAIVLTLAGGVVVLHDRAGGASVSAVPRPNVVRVVLMESLFAAEYTSADAATVRRLQTDLNGPTASGQMGEAPDCSIVGARFGAEEFVPAIYFTFMAGGQTVEHAVLGSHCQRTSLRLGFPPDFTLGAERGTPAAIEDIYTLAYGLVRTAPPHVTPPQGPGLTP